MLSGGAIICSLFVAYSWGQQIPLTGIDYPESVIGTTDFTKLFGGSDSKSVQTWATTSWNGLTTFAHAQPLRCFGEDAGVPYDVAVLGKHHFVCSVPSMDDWRM